VSTRKSRAYANVTFLDEAVEDLRRIAKRSPEVVKEVLRLLKQLDAGELLPRRLQDYAKTGDLTDCGKIVVEVEANPNTELLCAMSGAEISKCAK
jgi:addiction module RelE/StbE family toxin